MTTNEMMKIMDTEGEFWLIRPHMTIYKTLRDALYKAYTLSLEGVATSHIVLLPDDAIVVDKREAHNLWLQLGLVEEQVV